MKNTGPLHLLVVSPYAIDDPQGEVTQALAALRRAGADVSARAVATPQQLLEALASASSWDALLYFSEAPSLPLTLALETLADKSETPVFLCGNRSAQTVAQAILAGAAGYIAASAMAALGEAISREVATRALRLHSKSEQASAEARYRAITESVFDLICEIDEQGHIVYLSPNYTSSLGYQTAELLGSDALGAVHPDDRKMAQRAYREALAGNESGETQFRLKAKNGEYRWFEALLRRVGSPQQELGGETHVIQIARDITSHKRYEDELAALIALAKAINACSQLPEIARGLWSGLDRILPFDSLFIALRSEASGQANGEASDELCFVQYNAAGDASDCLTRENAGAHPVWQALDRDSPWLVNDWGDKSFGISDSAIQTRSFLSVPLQVDGQNWGVLFFDSASRDVFTEEHARLASMVGEQVAVAARQTQILVQARAARERFRHLVNDVNAIVWEAEPEKARFIYISPQVEEWLGYAPERLMYDETLWHSLIHPDDRERVLKEMQRAIQAGEDHQIDYRVTAADGRVLWLRNIVKVETRENIAGARQAVKLIGVSIDITERKQAEAALREGNAILRATQEAVAEGLCVVDENGVVVSCNTRFCEMWSIPAQSAQPEQYPHHLRAYLLEALDQPEEFLEKIKFLDSHPESPSREEVRLRNGKIFQCYSAPVTAPDGRTLGRVWTWSDISERKNYEEHLTHQAFHDALTDLANRTLFVDRVQHALSHLGRFEKSIAVLFLDLDRFKVVNDSMGHAVGDWLLCEVANRLRSAMRPGDTAARFGGDEFTLLLENISGVEDAVIVADRILDCLNEPFVTEGRELYISSSIGIAVSRGDESSAEDLLRGADIAMYRAKNKGKARYEVFDMEMSEGALDRLQLEIELRQAVKREQLHLDYQPLMDLGTQMIVGVEALVRWNHPQRGLVSPDAFIPIAEESGMIVAIGNWVLREACRQARRWHHEIPSDPPIRMSVNLSAKQFQQSNIVEEVAAVLEESGLDPACLELEITESAIMEDAETTVKQLEALKRLGVRLAIDDFGTGYSSLAYIERFPLDVLKIDRSFVSQIGRGGKSANGGEGSLVMQAVSTLGQGLGVRITAEGIETTEQLEHLRELGCNIGQGFLFAHPLAGESLTQLLSEKFALEQRANGALN